MRKIRLGISIIFIFMVICLIVIFNFNNIKDYTKKRFGGIVINETLEPVKITDNFKDKIILPEKTSRDLDSFDVDYIYVEKPIEYEGKIYSDGVIKICDFATVKIISKNDELSVKPESGIWLCKILNDYRWCPEVERN